MSEFKKLLNLIETIDSFEDKKMVQIPGAGSYSLDDLKLKALREAEGIVEQIKNENYKAAGYNAKNQLLWTLATLVKEQGQD
jgi:hypothetical protein